MAATTMEDLHDAKKLEGKVNRAFQEDLPPLPGSAEAVPVHQSGGRVSRTVGRMEYDVSPSAMDNRDPNCINQHVKVGWNDVIGEPEALRTPKVCWNAYKSCYYWTQWCIYVLLVVLLAPLLAFVHAFLFAILAFLQVWLLRPVFRWLGIIIATGKQFTEDILYASIGPLATVCGLYFSKIHVRYQRVPDGNAPDSGNYLNV